MHLSAHAQVLKAGNSHSRPLGKRPWMHGQGRADSTRGSGVDILSERVVQVGTGQQQQDQRWYVDMEHRLAETVSRYEQRGGGTKDRNNPCLNTIKRRLLPSLVPPPHRL
jgi:hypothetical protein